MAGGRYGPDWRNVAAPDFSGSLEGYRTAGAMLDRAFAGVDGLLAGVDNRLTEQARAGYMAQLQRFQDAEALQKALAQDPTLGRGMKRLNAETLADGSEMVDTLLARETDSANKEKLKLENIVAANKAAFAPKLNEAYRIAQLQGRQGLNKFLSENPDLVRAMEFEKAVVGALGVADKNVDVDGKIQDQGIDLVNFKDGQTDRIEERTATGLAQVIREGNATASGVRSALQEIKDPVLRAQTAKILQSDFAGLYGDVLMSDAAGSGGGGGSVNTAGGTGGASALRTMNYVARDYGFTAVPDTVRTLGQASAFAKQVNRAGASSSAMGLYQITGETLRDYAPRVFKQGWENVEFDFEAQDALGKAIFEDNKTSVADIRGRWAGLEKLPDAEVARLIKMPWEQARQVIARVESNGDPAAISGSTAVLKTTAEARNDEDNTALGTRSFAQNLGKNVDPVQATSALIKGGYYAAEEKKDVERVLRDIVRRGGGKISVANAADILANAPERDLSDYAMSNSTLDNIFNLKGEFESYIDEQVAQFRSGRKLTGVTTAIDRTERVEQLQAAGQQEAAAIERLRRLRGSGRASPREISAAEQELRGIQSTIRALRVEGRDTIDVKRPANRTPDDTRARARARKTETPVADFFNDVLSGNFFSFRSN